MWLLSWKELDINEEWWPRADPALKNDCFPWWTSYLHKLMDGYFHPKAGRLHFGMCWAAGCSWFSLCHPVASTVFLALCHLCAFSFTISLKSPHAEFCQASTTHTCSVSFHLSWTPSHLIMYQRINPCLPTQNEKNRMTNLIILIYIFIYIYIYEIQVQSRIL